MEASLCGRPGPTFVLAKPMTPRETTGNPGGIGCFLPGQYHNPSSNFNPAAGLRLPAQAPPVKGVGGGRRWQRQSFQVLKKRTCHCRAEAPTSTERTPDSVTPFRTVPDLVAYICEGPLVSKIGADRKSVTEVRCSRKLGSR